MQANDLASSDKKAMELLNDGLSQTDTAGIQDNFTVLPMADIPYVPNVEIF